MDIMEVIDKIYKLVEQYWLVVVIIGILLSFLESFIPILPLAAIVTANSVILGLWGGLVVSLIGSTLGAILLFYLSAKCSHFKFFQKHRNKRIDKLMEWIKKQGFKVICIIYSCPFVPGFLVTIASGFSGKDIKSFIPGLISGKFIYFFVVSYVSYDIQGLMRSPWKLIVLILMICISWIVGKRLNLKLN